MSALEDAMKEIYPHTVFIKSQIERPSITEWCTENGIYECDISILFTARVKSGWILRLMHMDDWMLAKLRWV